MMIRCVARMPFHIGSKEILPGRVCNLPLAVYREWRGRDFVSRVAQRAEVGGRRYLFFAEQPGVECRGAITDPAPIYYSGCTCIFDTEDLSDDDRDAFLTRAAQESGEPAEARAAALGEQQQAYRRERGDSKRQQLAWAESRLQAKAPMCCGGRDRLRALVRRLKKELEREQASG